MRLQRSSRERTPSTLRRRANGQLQVGPRSEIARPMVGQHAKPPIIVTDNRWVPDPRCWPWKVAGIKFMISA